MNFISKIKEFFTKEKEVPHNWGASIEHLRLNFDQKLRGIPDILKVSLQAFENTREVQVSKLYEEMTLFQKKIDALISFHLEIYDKSLNRHWQEIQEIKDSVAALKKNKVSAYQKRPVGRPRKEHK